MVDPSKAIERGLRPNLFVPVAVSRDKAPPAHASPRRTSEAVSWYFLSKANDEALDRVRSEASERIWMNIPPARIWVYRKD